jgi:hypothetical protein
VLNARATAKSDLSAKLTHEVGKLVKNLANIESLLHAAGIAAGGQASSATEPAPMLLPMLALADVVLPPTQPDVVLPPTQLVVAPAAPIQVPQQPDTIWYDGLLNGVTEMKVKLMALLAKSLFWIALTVSALLFLAPRLFALILVHVTRSLTATGIAISGGIINEVTHAVEEALDIGAGPIPGHHVVAGNSTFNGHGGSQPGWLTLVVGLLLGRWWTS